MVDLTLHLNLAKPDFNQVTWHDEVNENFDILDAAFFSITGFNITGVWANSTAYAVGDIAIDLVAGVFYTAQVAHTSAASGTFAADRTANPTYWLDISLSLAGNDGSLAFVQNSAPSVLEPEGSIWIDADSVDLDLYRLESGVWVDTGANVKGVGSGDVVGPASSINNDIALYDGPTGKLLKAETIEPLLFLAMGDSNFEGSPAFAWTANDRAFSWDGAAFIALDDTKANATEAFASRIADHSPLRRVYMVRSTAPGAGIDAWIPNSATEYVEAKTEIEQALTALGRTKVDGVLFSYGSADIATRSTLQSRMETVVTQLLAETWFDRDTPILAFGISPYVLTFENAAVATNNIIQQFVGADAEVRKYVNRARLPIGFFDVPTNYLHMTAEGYYLSGHTGADVWLRGFVPGRAYIRSLAASATLVGDADYAILPTDRAVITNAPFTAARAFTLPPAAHVPPGTPILVSDGSQSAVTGVNHLTVLRGVGSDLVNGAASFGGATVWNRGRMSALFISDGVSKWAVAQLYPSVTTLMSLLSITTGAIATVVGGAFTGVNAGTIDLPLVSNGPGVAWSYRQLPTAGLLDAAITNVKLANMAQATVKGRAAGAGTGVPTDLTAAQQRTILNVEDGAAADQSAAEVPFTPAGGIAATDVQAALVELDTEKEPADATILKDADIGGSVQAFDADLSALAANGVNGLWARTGAGAGAARAITAGINISVIDGDGVAGNPTIKSAKTTSNEQTDSYTLILTDEGKSVRMNKATANNLTVPPNSSVAFDIDTIINVEQYGAGQTTIVAGVGVTIRSRNGLKMAGQYAGGTLHKIGTDEWMLFGDLTP